VNLTVIRDDLNLFPVVLGGMNIRDVLRLFHVGVDHMTFFIEIVIFHYLL